MREAMRCGAADADDRERVEGVGATPLPAPELVLLVLLQGGMRCVYRAVAKARMGSRLPTSVGFKCRGEGERGKRAYPRQVLPRQCGAWRWWHGNG